MADMPTNFWGGWITVITVVSFMGLAWLIFRASKKLKKMARLLLRTPAKKPSATPKPPVSGRSPTIRG